MFFSYLFIWSFHIIYRGNSIIYVLLIYEYPFNLGNGYDCVESKTQTFDSWTTKWSMFSFLTSLEQVHTLIMDWDIIYIGSNPFICIDYLLFQFKLYLISRIRIENDINKGEFWRLSTSCPASPQLSKSILILIMGLGALLMVSIKLLNIKYFF